MRYILRRSITLGTAIGCVAVLVASVRAAAPDREQFDTLLARFDREPDGPGRDRLAAQIDTLAHQKYATVSRLYWYVDFDSAQAAARALGRPILHLRMLGRLDEDLSCANSRLFRTTLYANRDVSEFLRERFVLYWSSERPVPRVTIDYGDGRAIERTITGNSAHYVLDEDGQVLDVLPGLYAPAVFLQELTRAASLAARVRHQPADERARLVADEHRQHLSGVDRDWTNLAGVPGIADLRQRLAQPQNGNETALVAAERVTASKRVLELKDVRLIASELAPALPPAGEIETWSAAGRSLYGSDRFSVPSSEVLDSPSRALIIRLHAAPVTATDQAPEAMIARLEQTILADTAMNQLQVRPQISREIVRRAGRIDFATLNAWIYDQVFRTPRQDPWLGLLQRDIFTGLPGDGVVVRNR